MPSESNSDRISLLLSAQRALWGNVPATLRSASIQREGATLKWRCIFDANATEDDIELLQIAGTEILADFADSTGIDEEMVVVPYPKPLNDLDNLVFLRHELR